MYRLKIKTLWAFRTRIFELFKMGWLKCADNSNNGKYFNLNSYTIFSEIFPYFASLSEYGHLKIYLMWFSDDFKKHRANLLKTTLKDKRDLLICSVRELAL